jgi:cell wall assembly regulator SMI1
MKTVWNRIHAWLGENAPPDYGQLRPGATAEAIVAAEKAMGLELPADVRASYLIHDGQADEPGLIGGEGWYLMPLEEMIKSWQKCSKRAPSYRNYVPVAWGGAGDYIFLDLDPDAEKPGSLIVQRSDTNGADPVAPSFRLWLEDFAAKLEEEEFVYSEVDGCLMYADEIDLD